MDGAAAVAFAWEYASGVEVGFIDAEGVERSGPLACWWAEPFELALPVRPFASFKGQKNFTGEYWAATSRTQVGYESWVERDQGPCVVADWVGSPGDGRSWQAGPDAGAGTVSLIM